MTFSVPSSEPQVALKVPAHRFTQGGRTAYTLALTLLEIDSLLPQRVDQEVIRDANRRLTPEHAKAIQDYLESRDDWLLGAVLLGISPEAVKFNPYPEADGRPSKHFGELSLTANRINTLRIFDGQHRRRAIEETLKHLAQQRTDLRRLVEDAKKGDQNPEAIAALEQQTREISDRLRSLESASLPLVIYEEADIDALRRMFADAAKTKAIDRVTKARFDDRDAFNLAADELAEISRLFNGRVEMERSTIARTSGSLVAFPQLAEILRTLMYGYYGRVSRARNIELLEDRTPIIELGIAWADDFLPDSCETFEALMSNPDENDPAVLRKTTFALNATVLRVLAACYYGWLTEVGPDVERLSTFLRSQSFEPGARNSLLVRAGLVAPGGTSPVARRQEVVHAIEYIIAAARKG